MHEWAQQLATDLIGPNGRDITVIKETGRSGPDWDPGELETSEVTIKAFFTNITEMGMTAEELPPEVNVTDKMFLIDNQVVVNKGDKILDSFDGKGYDVIQSEPFIPGESMTHQTVWARG